MLGVERGFFAGESGVDVDVVGVLDEVVREEGGPEYDINNIAPRAFTSLKPRKHILPAIARDSA